jgi:hypothetical protein
MARGPLRSYLRDDEGEEDHDAYLEELIARQRAMSQMPPPGLPPQRQIPTRQQPGFADFLTLGLSGVADAFNARAGIRSDTFGRTYDLQQGMRNQAYQDQLAQSSAAYDADRMAYEDAWRRHGAEQSSFGREFDRAMRHREAQMLQSGIRGQQADAKKRKENYGRVLQEATKTEFGQVEDQEALKSILAKKLMDTQGDPDLEPLVRQAYQVRMQELARAQRPSLMQQAGERSARDILRSLGAPLAPGPEEDYLRFAPLFPKWMYDGGSSQPEPWNWYGPPRR